MADSAIELKIKTKKYFENLARLAAIFASRADASDSDNKQNENEPKND